VQVSVLVCLILGVKTLVRGRLAIRWHYWLWLLLLVRMIMPWAPESKFSIFTFVSQAKEIFFTQQVAERSSPVETAGTEPKATSDTASETISNLKRREVRPVRTTSQTVQASSRIRPLSRGLFEKLSLVWFSVASVLAVFALVCNFRLWRIIKSKRPLTEGKILDLLEDCKAEMGIQTILGLVVTDKVRSPSLFGVIRPRLLLPEGTLETLTAEQLRYVFLHELAHLKRRDIYLGWLMVVLQILHWFNPLVWFAFSRMRSDRELACDGLVLSTMGTDNSQAYGQALLNLFKGFSQIQFTPGIAGILENKSELKRRITMIAQFKKDSYKKSVLAIALLVLLAALALTNAQTAESLSDINAKVAQLDINRAVLDDVIEVFGEPLNYAWNQITIPRDKIPAERYCMIYPHGFSILMRQESIGELRFESPESGFVFRNQIRVGSSLDEVLAVLGRPARTIEGKPIQWTDADGVLYMDVDGRQGDCYYQRSDWNVRIYFSNYKVVALYVTSNSRPNNDNKVTLRNEDIPSTSFINEQGRIIDKVDYPFVNDPDAIGCWELVGIVKNIEDFDPDRTSKPQDFLLKELFIFENGRTSFALSWTKGLLIHSSSKTASKYVLEQINGQTYMFTEWKTGDYSIYHIKPNLCVFKKAPDKVYVETRTYDKVDYPFVDDPQAIGTWEAIDFVENPAEFDPGQIKWQAGEMFLSRLVIEPNGQMSQVLGNQAAEDQKAQIKRLNELLLNELGIGSSGKMSDILNKTVYEFDIAWTKVVGISFMEELSVDADTKMSEILSKNGPYYQRALDNGFSESFLSQVNNPDTKISEIINMLPILTKKVWTKGLIISPIAKIASRYEIQEIDGSTYMFYQWKTGDYVLRQMKPKYYVLKKK
jgi:bla regulator protein BlaR1